MILSVTKQVIVSNERAFTLNHVYSGEATQNQIFEELVDPVVCKVMQGFNACVMAYGQTGSGKTFTMGTKVKVNIRLLQLSAYNMHYITIFPDRYCAVFLSYVPQYSRLPLQVLFRMLSKKFLPAALILLFM